MQTAPFATNYTQSCFLSNIWEKKGDNVGILLVPEQSNTENILIQSSENFKKSKQFNSRMQLNGRKITILKIEQQHKNVHDFVLAKLLKIKKSSTKREQFLEDHFVQLALYMQRKVMKRFCLKGVFGVSLNKSDPWIFVAIQKLSDEILYCFANAQLVKLELVFTHMH